MKARHCILAGTTAALGAVAAAAGIDDEAAAMATQKTQTGTFELSSSQETVSTPLATSPSHVPAFQSATQTMLWARRDRLSLGLGVEQRWPTASDLQGLGATAEQRQRRLLFGVALATSDRLTLVWRAPLAMNGNNGGSPAPDGQRDMHAGLQLQSSDTLRDLRRGLLMRVELSDQTVLAIKPRHGRFALTLNSQW